MHRGLRECWAALLLVGVLFQCYHFTCILLRNVHRIAWRVIIVVSHNTITQQKTYLDLEIFIPYQSIDLSVYVWKRLLGLNPDTYLRSSEVDITQTHTNNILTFHNNFTPDHHSSQFLCKHKVITQIQKLTGSTIGHKSFREM